MSKNKVSKNFSRSKYSNLKLSEFTKKVIEAMTENVNFPSPSPTLEAIATADAAFDSAIKKADGGLKIDTMNRNKCRTELTTLLSDLADYVQFIAKGDEIMIESSGFNLNQTKKEPIGELPNASNLKVKAGPNSGSMIVSCKAISGAMFYVFEYTDAPATAESSWKEVTSTKHQVQIDGLTSGHQYVFRAAGGGADPSRNWSASISSYVM